MISKLPPGFLSITQAAGLLGISRQRLHVILRTTNFAGRPWLRLREVEYLRTRVRGKAGRPPRAQEGGAR